MVIIIRRKTMNQFMSEMNEKHPTLEVLSEYVNNRTKVNLRCKICGHEFSAVPASLYMGHGCPPCHGYIIYNQEKFVDKISKQNPKIIVLGNYINSQTKIDVKCKDCGYEWKATPNALLKSKSCPKCYGRIRRTTEEFEKILQEKHPYISVVEDYKNKSTNIRCYCSRCGQFFYKIPSSVIRQDAGCPICNNRKSRGEKAISDWLNKNNIKYTKDYSFPDCKDIHILPFDFYLHDFNTIIEYDGKQHFEPVEYFGGEDAFQYRKRHDEIKNNYCFEKGIDLIRIPYWDFKNIDEILKTKLAI